SGDTIEEQLTGTAKFGGMQLRLFESKPGRFPDVPPPGGNMRFEAALEAEPGVMGLAAGGSMRQKIYPDAYGIDVWDPGRYPVGFIHTVNSHQYSAITGRQPPPSPVSPQLYTNLGLPWFALYDEERGDVAAPARLTGVQSLKERDAQRGDPADP